MATAKKNNIIRAVGRRKAAIANVILKPGSGKRKAGAGVSNKRGRCRSEGLGERAQRGLRERL